MKYSGLVKITNKVKQLMKEQNKTIQYLSDTTGRSRVHLSLFLNCHVSVKIESLAEIALALGVDVRELLNEVETEEMI